MPTVEIDEVELQRLHKQDGTVRTLLANPKAKKKVFEAYKEQWPDVKIPELEMEEAARAPVAALQETVAKLSKQIEDDAAKREHDAKLSSLTGSIEQGKIKLRQKGWTDEGIAAVEKLMEEKGTTDIAMAAAYYEQQNPPPAPATPRGFGTWDFVQPEEGESYAKALLSSKSAAENDHLVMQEASKALNEIRGASRR